MKKILIINSNYYIDISKSLVNSAKNFLKKNKIQVNLINVPGIFETPIVLKKNINKFDGFVVLGCVIKGETPHFDLISRSTFDAILKISIDYSKPVCNGIITAYNKKQAGYLFMRDKLSNYDRDALRLNNYVIRVKQLDQGDF